MDLKVRIIADQQKVNTGCSVLVPLDASSLERLKGAAEAYGLGGLDLISKQLNKCKGASVAAFQGKESGRALVLIHVGQGSSAVQVRKWSLGLAARCKSVLGQSICIDLRFLGDGEDNVVLPYLVYGLMLGSYQIGRYKSDNKTTPLGINDWTILSDGNHAVDPVAIVNRYHHISETTKSCLDLVNDPSNRKNAQTLANWAILSAGKYNYSTRILDKQQLEKEGFHALLAVNRGSEVPACCIVSEYIPGNAPDDVPTVALVGKGVTFDTGGLSLKRSSNMYLMKSDMGGAAAVLGTIEIVARMQLPVRVICIVPATDNSVGSLSIKPGDVISSYQGSTIEVIDTDAEGRLLLADGLAYAVRNYKPDYLIDMATLTGNVIGTLGIHAAGLMSSDDHLAEALAEAGHRSGERVWRLPLWDDYASYLKSDIADIRNLSNKPAAGAITAGKFLQHFTDKHSHWAHLDMGGPAFHENPLSRGRSATGFGILLLINWLESLR